MRAASQFHGGIPLMKRMLLHMHINQIPTTIMMILMILTNAL